MEIPTFQDVLEARNVIRQYIPPTPLHSYAALNELIGTTVYVKHENYQPIGAFKIRGALNLASHLTEDERRRGLITASTGNHGQSVAYAGNKYGVPVKVVVPEETNPGKVAAIQAFGAEVIFHGERFDDARLHSEDLARQHGYRYVHVANERLTIAGVATETLEMLEQEPDLDVIIVPVGGGSGASGACITAKSIRESIAIIGVQSAQAPAAYESWRSKSIQSRPNETFAEGLSTGTGFELTQTILQKYLDDFVLADDGEIKQAVVWMLEKAHALAEGAGVASLAAAYKLRQQLTGKKVAIVCSGGNLSLPKLNMVLG